MSERERTSGSSLELHQATTSCITKDNKEDTRTSLEPLKGRAPEPNKETASVDEEVGKKAPQCRFFKKAGNCRYGDRCKFAHEIASPTAATAARNEEASAEGNNAEGDNQDDPNKISSREKAVILGDGEQKVCRFFSRSGWCRNGKRCKFLHEKVKARAPSKPDEVDASKDATVERLDEEEVPQDQTSSSKAEDDRKKQAKPKIICRYFKAGRCSAGDRCKFSHRGVERSSESTAQRKPIGSKQERHAMARPDPIQESMKLAELGEDDMQRLRETEITQLTKRFPGDQMTRIETEAETIYRVTIHPSDPDWPYDIKDFEFEVMFPASYPVDPFTISMPEDQELPDSVLTHMQEAIVEWIHARHGTNQITCRVELMFRPFLRWLDRSLEKLFTTAAKQFKKVVDAKAAGIEFVPYANQKPPEPRNIRQYHDINHPNEAQGVMIKEGTPADQDPNTASDAQPADTETGDRPSEETGSQPAVKKTEGRPDVNASDGKDPNKYGDLFNIQRRGTEIKFSKIELSESVSTLVAQTVGVTIQCSRCKNHCDVVTPPKRVNMARCGKCQHQQLLTYRQSLVHHFTATLGFLDLEGCTTFDLILTECEFNLGCLNCSEETKVTGLQFGQTRTTWCQKCHSKMTLLMETAKFHQLQVQGMETRGSQKTHNVPVKQLRNQVHPDIHEGHPLPNNGACKHFKKSLRWFRFPCCGKCYACDECHDESETDHEMKYATRMICGFCCKEQQYTIDKPCISCQSLTTKGRTSHWEGGSGCRNKTKMSKNDRQKYSSTNKTISRKQQKLVE